MSAFMAVTYMRLTKCQWRVSWTQLSGLLRWSPSQMLSRLEVSGLSRISSSMLLSVARCDLWNQHLTRTSIGIYSTPNIPTCNRSRLNWSITLISKTRLTIIYHRRHHYALFVQRSLALQAVSPEAYLGIREWEIFIMRRRKCHAFQDLYPT